MKFIVSKNDRVYTKVYVYETDANTDPKGLEATQNLDDIPKDAKYETINLTFKKPTYRDSKEIINSCSFSIGGEVKVDVVKLQDKVLTQLLVDWDLKDEDGNKIEYNQSNLSSIEPTIARACSASILAVVKI